MNEVALNVCRELDFETNYKFAETVVFTHPAYFQLHFSYCPKL